MAKKKKKNATRKPPMKFKPMGSASTIKSKTSVRSAQKPSSQSKSFASMGGGGGK
jgi:hypothetical protein